MTSPKTPPKVADLLQPSTTFDVACTEVLEYLDDVIPMGLWAATRVVDGRQIMLGTVDRAYGFGPGAEIAFADSPCWSMVSGDSPQIATDAAAVPGYAHCAVAAVIPLGAYIGTPIVTRDGRLFGTVCGFNPSPLPASLRVHLPLLKLLSGLLSSVLWADQALTVAERRLEVVQMEADTDVMTGLLNRRGWERFIEREEDRFRRFGDQASVIIMDLDRLKTINDTQGHEAGDVYICEAARVLGDSLRFGDVLARLGGDEFGLIIRGLGAEAVAQFVARTSAALDRNGIAGSFGHAPITIIAGFPGAWKKADSGMYAEKRRRKVDRETP